MQTKNSSSAVDITTPSALCATPPARGSTLFYFKLLITAATA
jgi:hypothetical protein